MRRIILSICLALAACGSPQAADTGKDVAAIENQMRARFDKPAARLEAGPTIVSGDYAVADWTQGAMGGRALFERRDGKWTIILCSGDALRNASVLKQARLPDADAEAIAHELSNAERSVARARLAKMSRFQGTVMADQMP